MILPLLLAAALDGDPAAPPPSETTRVVLAFDGNGGVQSSTYSGADSTSNGPRAGGDFDVTFYLRHQLVDDDAPRNLQAFLQRTTTLDVHGGGLYLHLDYSPTAGGGGYHQDYTDELISTRVFFLHNLAFLGSVGTNYLHDDRVPAAAFFPITRDIWEPNGSIGLDARAGSSSLALTWQLVGVHQRTADPAVQGWRDVFWPRLTLAGRTILGRQYDLTAGVTVIPDGVEARAGLGIYPTKDLGLTAGVEVDHGQIYVESATDYDRLSGTLGVSYWIEPRMSLGATYTPSRVTWTDGTQWSHVLNVALTARVF